MTFDQKIIEHLQSYVYALIDPDDGKPFYIGKGKGNRVFGHVACDLENETASDKYETIRRIKSQGKKVKHLIIRHGLSDEVAFAVESALIDFAGVLGISLTNEVLGHHVLDSGLMTSEEIIRRYGAEPLDRLSDPAIIININKTYKKGYGSDGIYNATKESWVIAAKRRNQTRYALAEFRGLIIEAYKIENWYPVETKDKNGNPKIRWGFNGTVAEKAVREKYINKSIVHSKRRGASNPIRYKI